MRVLVTGAGGFIGANVVRQLALAGHDVLAVGRRPEPLGRLVAPGLGPISPRVLDLDDAGAVHRYLHETRPEAVVHLAWYAAPGDYLHARANLASLAMTVGLVQAALDVGCARLVLAGSCVEYAASDRPRLEDDPVEARTLYAACKASAWSVSRLLAEEAGAHLSWARIFHIHGPDEDPRRLIPWVARQLRDGGRVPLTDGTQVRDHLHVEDVAAALVALLTSSAVGVTNVCSGAPVTLRHVLETVGDILGRRELLDFGARPHRPAETMFLAGDAHRLRALGWRPRFDLRDGLADALLGAGRARV